VYVDMGLVCYLSHWRSGLVWGVRSDCRWEGFELVDRGSVWGMMSMI